MPLLVTENFFLFAAQLLVRLLVRLIFFSFGLRRGLEKLAWLFELDRALSWTETGWNHDIKGLVLLGSVSFELQGQLVLYQTDFVRNRSNMVPNMRAQLSLLFFH